MPKPPPDITHLQVSPPGPADRTAEADLAAKTRAVEKSRKDVAAGRVVGHDKVKAWLKSWGSDKELPRPRPSDPESTS